jgi:hypothetical protein
MTSTRDHPVGRDRHQLAAPPSIPGGGDSGPRWCRLGTSGAGGWALSPADGAASSPPVTTLWGVPVYRCADLTVGMALAADWSTFDIYRGNDFRIDVSSEAGSRFDQNVTGYRAEEDFGFTAEPPVRTGKVVKILGL